MINILQLWKNDPEIELNAKEINDLIEAYKRREKLLLEKLNIVKKVLLLASNGENLKIETVGMIESKCLIDKLSRNYEDFKKKHFHYIKTRTREFRLFINSPAIIDKNLKIAVPVYSFDCGSKEREDIARII